jgi:hypothetical protein
LALRVIAERLENDEVVPEMEGLFLVAAWVNERLSKPEK